MVELNAAQEKDLDELEDDYQSDDDDPNVFKVRDALMPPSAMSYSAQELQSTSANTKLVSYSLTYR
jgi:hypothetical protein